MALPDAIEGETGRAFSITWENVGDLTSAVITGIIETVPGPTYTSRLITGALAFVSFAAPSSVFTWTLSAADTAVGNYTVQFTATTGAVIVKSYPEPWKVIRKRTTPS